MASGDRALRVAGVMSGTSADGVDVAVAAIEGPADSPRWSITGSASVPYPAHMRSAVLAAADTNIGIREATVLARDLASVYAEAVKAAADTPCDLIACHGQTVWHSPPSSAGPGVSVQLCDHVMLAALCCAPVVSGFRAADLVLGGEGAPLVPLTDHLMFAHPVRNRAAVNIGGIANVTLLPAGAAIGDTVGFDTGPGNMVVDWLVASASRGAQVMDTDGAIAAAGVPEPVIIASMLADPWFDRTPPKSTGRERFGAAFAADLQARSQAAGLDLPSTLATAVDVTASSIASAVQRWGGRCAQPDDVILSGGGALNTTLLRRLESLLPGSTVVLSDAFGVPIQLKEALAFALLGYRFWCGAPGNLPSVTGASRPCICGVLTPPPDGCEAPWWPVPAAPRKV